VTGAPREISAPVRVLHLARRWLGSLSRRRPSADDFAWVRDQLLPVERAMWHRFGVADQRHTIGVARRFVDRRPEASRAEVAGALLHDIGKLDAGLGTTMRVVATVVGPRTSRFARYHDHERIGAEWLTQAGSDPATVELVLGRGPAALDLRAADDG
jgi:hypothetical protein